MNGLIVLFILLPAFSFHGVPHARAESTEVPAAAVNAEELRGIRDRLVSSLFFRGELADKIIEAGLYGRFVKLAGQETHSDVRLALLGWINKNQDEAARLYFYLKGRGASDARPAEVIEYAMPSWQINPDFLELVEGVNRVAGGAAVSKEEMSLAALLLFDSSQAAPEADTPRIPGAGSYAGAAGGAAAIEYADYTLNAAGADRESRALGAWLENLGFFPDAGPAETGKNKAPGRERRLFDETFSLYRGFVVALSGLKGRAKITREEAGRLEAVRRPLRKNLAVLEALALLRGLGDTLRQGVPARANRLRPDAPGAEVLLADALRIEGAAENFISGLENDPGKLRSAGLRLSELGKAFEFWALRFSAHQRLVELKDRIEGRGFSCVLDMIVFKYLARFFPSSDYVRRAAAQAVKAETIELALEGVAAGDYRSAALFSGGGAGSLMEKTEEAEADAARLESYSRFNRLLQYVFWDIFANPLCLEPGPRGIAADNGFLFRTRRR